MTGGLAAVIVAAGGFVGGVQVQKRQAATRGRRAAAAAGAAGCRAAALRAAAAATPATRHDRHRRVHQGQRLYVKDADGNTIKVKVKSSAT